jgi:hypothetical protein
MAASSVAGSLQSNFDEAHAATTVPSSSKGSTDVIRVMLREQKRECATLHANPLFKEFRDRQKRSSRTGHGHDAQAPPVIEDLEAGECLLGGMQRSSASHDLRGTTATMPVKQGIKSNQNTEMLQTCSSKARYAVHVQHFSQGCFAGKHDMKKQACSAVPNPGHLCTCRGAGTAD